MSDESSSDEGSVSSHSDSEFDLERDVIDPSNIIPYDFEPEISAESSGGSESEEESEENEGILCTLYVLLQRETSLLSISEKQKRSGNDPKTI